MKTKPCPFCGDKPLRTGNCYTDVNKDCPLCDKVFTLEEWNTRNVPSVAEIAEKLLRPSKSKEMNVNFGVVNEHKARYLAQAIHDRL